MTITNAVFTVDGGPLTIGSDLMTIDGRPLLALEDLSPEGSTFTVRFKHVH